jgi:alkylhydroperoxidase family enzyme
MAWMFKRDCRSAPLDSRTRALLDFAWKVTTAQWECREGDVDGLRRTGWSEEAIADPVEIIAFFHFITRVADALGVALNEEYAALRRAEFGEVAR